VGGGSAGTSSSAAASTGAGGVGDGGVGPAAATVQALRMPTIEECLTFAARAGLPLSICTPAAMAASRPVNPARWKGYDAASFGAGGAAAPPAAATGPNATMALTAEFNPARYRNTTECLNAASAQHLPLSLCRRR
jgi:hypothetical protein